MGFFKDFWDGGQSEAKKKNEAVNKQLQALFGEASSLGQSLLMKAAAKLEQQYTTASANLGKAGEAATLGIMANADKANAAGKQALIDSGFSGTIAAQLPGQVAAQTNQSLAGLAEGVGAQQANLDMGYGTAQANQAQGFANWALNQVGTANAIAPQYKAAGKGFGGAFAESLGSAAGDWVTGGFSLPGGGGGGGGGNATNAQGKSTNIDLGLG